MSELINKITVRIRREGAVFQQLNRESKLLLLCSGLFWFAGPFIGLFLNIYLWREANSLGAVALFNLFKFVGLPIGFIINGFLLKKISNKTAFQLGLILQAVFPFILIVLKDRAFQFLVPLGLINGLNEAFYWANMNLLIYDLTFDKIRGYFSGLDITLSSIFWIIAPPLAGFVIESLGQNRLHLSIRHSYYLSFLIAGFIFMVAAVVANKIIFQKVRPDFSLKNISLTNKSKKWASVRLLNVASGFYWGIFAFSFGLLAFKFFGKELEVGWFNGLMGVISALAGYLAGRYAAPERRLSATILGVIVFFLGSIFFGINFSIFGFYTYAILVTIGDTFLWMVHLPIEMKEMDRGYLPEAQRYLYWVDVEIFLNLGRILGIIIFICLTNFFTFELVYRLIIVLIGFAPFIGLKAIRNLVST